MSITTEDAKFLKEYKKENYLLPKTERLPCLKCSDEQIVSCSKKQLRLDNPNSQQTIGCYTFKFFSEWGHIDYERVLN